MRPQEKYDSDNLIYGGSTTYATTDDRATSHDSNILPHVSNDHEEAIQVMREEIINMHRRHAEDIEPL